MLTKTLESPLDCKESNQLVLKEINPEYSLEVPLLKLGLQNFGHLIKRGDSLEKTWIWGSLRAGEKEATEDEMVGWHRRLNGYEFEQTP